MRRILIVDDQPKVTQRFAQYLTDQELEVTEILGKTPTQPQGTGLDRRFATG